VYRSKIAMRLKKLNITEARRQLCQIVAEQEASGSFQDVAVTQRGKPAVVIVGIDRFRELVRKAQATDPFDLLIVAVARTLGSPLITKDATIEAAHLLPTLW
jgi:prevent-host-death family protein